MDLESKGKGLFESWTFFGEEQTWVKHIMKLSLGVHIVAQWVNVTAIHKMQVCTGLARWVRESGFGKSCGVGCRCGLDLASLWRRLAAAALI